MSGEVLDWKSAVGGPAGRAAYVRQLSAFMAEERDTPDRVAAALKQGQADMARSLVHGVRIKAGQVGAHALCAAAMELEMAVKAGADTAQALGRFMDAHMDALVSMHAFMTS